MFNGCEAEYSTAGYFCCPHAVAKEDLGAVSEELKCIIALLPGLVVYERQNEIGTVRDLHRTPPELAPVFSAFRTGPLLSEAACRMLGSDRVRLVRAWANSKPGLGGNSWPWHRDSWYWHRSAERLDNFVTAIVNLGETTVFNGCLCVLPESHRVDPACVIQEAHDAEVAVLRTRESLTSSSIEALELPAGSITYLHRDLLHASGTNLSGADRRCLVFVLAATHG